jgi:hypothetical protein
MPYEDFTALFRILGTVTAWSTFFIGVFYAVTLILGLISLKSSQDPIGDPYFTILELLIILLAPLMVITMIAIHAYAPDEVKAYSLTALVFMIVMAVITSTVHFVVLTVSRQIEAGGLAQASLLFSFKWPSVVYALDILAWDWFFALSILFASPVFIHVGLETAIRYIMVVSGILSLVGLLGVPLAIMKVKNWLYVRFIGVVGYAFVSPLAFLLLAILFGGTK